VPSSERTHSSVLLQGDYSIIIRTLEIHTEHRTFTSTKNTAPSQSTQNTAPSQSTQNTAPSHPHGTARIHIYSEHRTFISTENTAPSHPHRTKHLHIHIEYRTVLHMLIEHLTFTSAQNTAQNTAPSHLHTTPHFHTSHRTPAPSY
jgi:hypothetical protein